MNKQIFIIAFVMSIICSVSFSGTMRHDVSQEKYIDYGRKFYCVKKVVGVKENKEGKTYSIGSCVVLNSHWIITCAHIAEDEVDYINVVIDDKEHLINKFIINKDYSKKKLQADIALGFCEKGFGQVEEPLIHRGKIKLNEYCSFAGYGRYGTMITGANKYDGQLRGGTNRIDSFFKLDMVVVNGSRDRTRTQLEFLPNVGDSGGGLFIQGKLAGITSLVLSLDKVADSNYGDEGAFVQIYPHLEWIDKYVKKK